MSHVQHLCVYLLSNLQKGCLWSKSRRDNEGLSWPCIPVETEAVEALLAWLVNRVESGAGILLLSAIWKWITKTNTISTQKKTVGHGFSSLQPLLPRGPGSVGSVSNSDPNIQKEKQIWKLCFYWHNRNLFKIHWQDVIYLIFLDGPLARVEPAAGRFQGGNLGFQNLDSLKEGEILQNMDQEHQGTAQ